MSVLLALLLDAALGEPRALWDRVPHPAVAMGRAVAALDARLNRGPARLLSGALAYALLASAALVAGVALAALPGRVAYAYAILACQPFQTEL